MNNSTWKTLLLWPLSYHNCGSLEFFIHFQIATLQSSLPEAMRSPCSLKFSEFTQPSWKFSFDFSSNLCTNNLDATAFSLNWEHDSSPNDLLSMSHNGFHCVFLTNLESIVAIVTIFPSRKRRQLHQLSDITYTDQSWLQLLQMIVSNIYCTRYHFVKFPNNFQLDFGFSSLLPYFMRLNA